MSHARHIRGTLISLPSLRHRVSPSCPHPPLPRGHPARRSLPWRARAGRESAPSASSELTSPVFRRLSCRRWPGPSGQDAASVSPGAKPLCGVTGWKLIHLTGLDSRGQSKQWRQRHHPLRTDRGPQSLPLPLASSRDSPLPISIFGKFSLLVRAHRPLPTPAED